MFDVPHLSISIGSGPNGERRRRRCWWWWLPVVVLLVLVSASVPVALLLVLSLFVRRRCFPQAAHPRR